MYILKIVLFMTTASSCMNGLRFTLICLFSDLAYTITVVKMVEFGLGQPLLNTMHLRCSLCL